MFVNTDNHDFANIPDVNNKCCDIEDKELIRQSIQKLCPKYRKVIVLRLINRYSTEETAKLLKLPIGTILSRMFRAQKELKLLLQPYFGGQ